MANEDDEFPFLQEASSPRTAHKIDIVFVHGLNPRGSSRYPYETWTHQNGRFWPADFLAEDLPFARIFVYGYNSDVSQPEYMSVGRIKNHADTLLNLLDLERSSSQGPSPARIIFIGHSLGGLVIKHALLNAQENPKYNAIRTATYGLVFFGCPHHGAKGAELGMIAANVARFVSADRASNELLESLKTNSLFTRQMSERFRHQLEDYRVVSFIEGLPMHLSGTGPTSISHVVVDEDSAVLGLTGLRETQLMLDADHIGICKIGSKGAMYRMVKGNIKSLVDQALVTTQGYVPPLTTTPTPPTAYPTPPSGNPFSPPLPPRPSASGQPYPTNQPPEKEEEVTGLMFPPVGDDKNSIELAKYKNMGLWDKAQQLEHQIFKEQQRTLGPDNLKTLTTGHNLAATYLELAFVNDATNWATWVATTSQRTLGPKHPLFMKNESLTGEILIEKGLYTEAETQCANILARQQDYLGDDHLDTLETQRRLGLICKYLGRQQDAIVRLQKRSESLARVLGNTHIQIVAAALDLIEVMIPSPVADTAGIARFTNEVQQAAKLMPPLYQDLRGALGPQHPLSIRALRVSGTVKSLEGNATDASDTLRRALSNAEEALGHDHVETLNIVAMIGMTYCKQTPGFGLGRPNGLAEMRPWLERYLAWTERRKGPRHPEATATLGMLGMAAMIAKDYLVAEKYYERLVEAYGPQNTSRPAQEAVTMLRACQMNTMFLKPQNAGGDLAGMLKGFRF